MTAILWQRLEGALVLAGGLAFVFAAGLQDLAPWWVMALLFFAPDLSFAGYLAGPQIGAAVYNAAHLYATGILVMLVGEYFDPAVALSGILWLSHAGFDRMLGYGLKEPSGFQDTHLGRIGR